MLDIIPKASNALNSIIKYDFSLVLTSERGMLRLKPQNDEIIRVTYTERNDFSSENGIGICNEQDFSDWTYEETDTEVVLSLAKVQAHVNKKTLAITYYDGTKLLLAERAKESHELVSFDAFKTVVDENTEIEEIDTVDGKKQRIKSATQAFDKKLYHTRLHLNFQDNEKLYGLGQAEEGVLNLRGTTQYLHQANLKIAIPMLLSTKGYGILFSTASPAIFNDTQYGSYFHTEADAEMDFYFIAGEKFDDIVKSYRHLTGKAVMLPRWAFGFIQSQERYETEEEVLQVAKGHVDRNIGLDCLVMDWRSWVGEGWGQKSLDYERFPDPLGMNKKLHADNIHYMLSIWPNMNIGTENHREFADAGLLLPTNIIYDAFNPEARKLYWKQANEGLFQNGIDAWWCDSCEPFCPEWKGDYKPEPTTMYYDFIDVASKYLDTQYTNAYGLVHAQTMYEGQRSVTQEKRVTNLTRNTYTGGQRYGAILWSGDTFASWQTLKNQIVAGLNFCACGLPYWTLDIGAFFVKECGKWFRNGEYDNGLDDLGYKELFVRWFQYGAFLPMFRSHGTDIRREMWLFDGENHMFYESLLKANKLRYTLIAYIYSLANKIYTEDSTMMKMLAFDFPEDEIATSIKDEYMFGDILVCPVTTPMYYDANSTPIIGAEKSREVYLPKGADWFNFYTNEVFCGGQTITVEADINSIPLFVKAGSIIPMTEPLTNTKQVETAQITVHVYAGCDCEFNLYEDSGDGYDYENGDYTNTLFTWNDNEKKLTISNNAERFNVVIHD